MCEGTTSSVSHQLEVINNHNHNQNGNHSSDMFARHQPSSPLSTISYTNTLTTPSKPITASANATRQPSPAFPPELGSSSPPMSSPTSFRISERARTHSSAGLFAARARAVQPPLQRSSSLVQGHGHGHGHGGGSHAPAEGRYGPRPGMRKHSTTTTTVTTGAGVASTGYALHRPLATREDESSRSRPMTSAGAGAGGEGSIQGSMWKGKFRRRCLAASRRREDSMDAEDGEADPQAEAEHEEASALLFTRLGSRSLTVYAGRYSAE